MKLVLKKVNISRHPFSSHSAFMEELSMKIWKMVIASMLLCFLLVSSVTGDDQESGIDLRTSAFYGMVSDNDTGEPIINALIYSFDSDYQNYYKTITDENGYYYLEVDFGGVYYLYANKEDYDDQECIAWVEPGNQNEVNFNLDPKQFDHVIFGEVVDSDSNERLSDVHIILYSYVGDVPRPLKEHDTNSSGEFLFNLNDGRYTLSFEKKDYYLSLIHI
jgi:hypothetical protein